MEFAVAFILALCSVAITASPGSNRCCYPDQFHGIKHVLVDNFDVYYRVDFKKNLMYQTLDKNGESYNITDIAANKGYVVTKAGCRIVNYESIVFNQCYDSSDLIVGIGHSEQSYEVRRHTVKTEGLAYKIIMQHRNGMCVPVSAVYDAYGYRFAMLFVTNSDVNIPTPPDMDTVKAMCS